ncbi:hypothetical protein H9P43_004103 [Blastocladiella emersonii ATCC 22665]|nr:hypothetical protein H9P43_004103 [Blastocladiella emersonii ATCC 22665]
MSFISSSCYHYQTQGPFHLYDMNRPGKRKADVRDAGSSSPSPSPSWHEEHAAAVRPKRANRAAHRPAVLVADQSINSLAASTAPVDPNEGCGSLNAGVTGESEVAAVGSVKSWFPTPPHPTITPATRYARTPAWAEDLIGWSQPHTGNADGEDVAMAVEPAVSCSSSSSDDMDLSD